MEQMTNILNNAICCIEYKITVKQKDPHRCYPHLNVVVGFEYSRDPESYAGGSVATGRATQAGEVKG
jgi:hypothetical protein